MRLKILFSILVLFTCLAAACIDQAANTTPTVIPSVTPAPKSYGNGSGMILTIAFNEERLSSASQKARERVLTGATLLSQEGRYDESLVYFDEALAIDKNFFEAWVAKAVALNNLKRIDESIACYDKALELAPREAGIWHMKGLTLQNCGKEDEAAECFRRAAELDPQYKTP